MALGLGRELITFAGRVWSPAGLGAPGAVSLLWLGTGAALWFHPALVAAVVARAGFGFRGRSRGMGGAGAQKAVLDGERGSTAGGVWVVSPNWGLLLLFPWIFDLFLLLGEEETCRPSGSAFLLIQS